MTERPRDAIDFEQLARLSPALVAVMRSDATFEWANDTWRTRLDGLRLTDTSLLRHVHPDDVERTRAVFAELGPGQSFAPFAVRLLVGRAEVRWLEGHLRRGGDGRIFCAFRDATTERAEHAAVLRKKELLQLAEELADIGHWRYDDAAKTLHWSQGVFRIHGRDPALGVPALADAIMAYHPEDRAAVSRAFEGALYRGEPFSFQLRLIREDGAVRVVRSVGRAELDPGTRAIAAVFGVFTDVTEAQALHDSLRAAKLAAEEASRIKSRFLANMSHEIRTPLNGIVGTAEVMRAEQLQPRIHEMVETICMASQSLQTVIDDVLDLSKVEAGLLDLQPIPFLPGQLVREVWTLFVASAREKGLSLVVDTEPGATPEVVADPNRLRQVLSNLVGNALKFTSRGEVRIVARLTREHLRFEVHDTGIGIPREAMGRIFDAFKQADDSTSRRFGGTGLGLTISRQLVTLMGGQLEVESEVGVGSVFWFQIPIGTADQAQPKQPGREGATRRRSGRSRVLVAEDNPVNQRVVRALLAQLDCDVSLVPNGVLAVEAATSETWDLVLMDCQMPELDGLAATRAIRAAGLHALPIVALTASALDEERAACMAAGMNDFLAKPLRRAPLEDILGRWSGEGP